MKLILRILFFPLTLLRLLLVVLISLFFVVAVRIEYLIAERTGNFTFWSARYWGRSMLIVLGFWVKRNKCPRVKGYLLMPNHRSYIDIFLMAAYSPSAFVAKAEIQKWPLLGWVITPGHIITVKRNELKSLLGTMKKIKESIENNISITIFPEGTTHYGPELGKFKNGTFKIAAELNIPIIPCAIKYGDNENAWVSDDLFINHFFRQLWKPISLAEVRFGEPITCSDYQKLKELTKEKIEDFLQQMG